MATEVNGRNQPKDPIRVQDAGRILEFSGDLLAEISTETQREPRWLEMQVYKVTDGTGRYVLHLIGRSVVYHTHQSKCNRGITRTPSASDWAGDAEPCRVCKPPHWRELDPVTGIPVRDLVTQEFERDPQYADTQFELEMDRHTSYVCASADDVVEQLRQSSRHQRASGTLSAPAQRLLDAAADKDDAIGRAIRVVEKL